MTGGPAGGRLWRTDAADAVHAASTTVCRGAPRRSPNPRGVIHHRARGDVAAGLGCFSSRAQCAGGGGRRAWGAGRPRLGRREDQADVHRDAGRGERCRSVLGRGRRRPVGAPWSARADAGGALSEAAPDAWWAGVGLGSARARGRRCSSRCRWRYGVLDVFARRGLASPRRGVRRSSCSAGEFLRHRVAAQAAGF